MLKGPRRAQAGKQVAPNFGPEEIRDRIFFPLVSGREDGSGLGLTLAQSFVHQHDGLIEVESRPGCTEFALLLPFES
jgi:two-component system nitrogen regulation sensor histidine kinase GlnL